MFFNAYLLLPVNFARRIGEALKTFQEIAMEDGISEKNGTMIKKLEDELKVMSIIVKGRCKNLENVKVIEDIAGTQRCDLLKLSMELHAFSKKLLETLKDSSKDLSASDIPSLVRKELTDLVRHVGTRFFQEGQKFQKF